jgi:hypothetical protein
MTASLEQNEFFQNRHFALSLCFVALSLTAWCSTKLGNALGQNEFFQNRHFALSLCFVALSLTAWCSTKLGNALEQNEFSIRARMSKVNYAA